MVDQYVLATLEPLFETANQENLWFYHQQRDLWFSPKELKAAQEAGQYVWGVKNWILRSPYERLSELEQRKTNIELEITRMQERIQQSRK